jgi:hypothetical protein
MALSAKFCILRSPILSGFGHSIEASFELFGHLDSDELQTHISLKLQAFNEHMYNSLFELMFIPAGNFYTM